MEKSWYQIKNIAGQAEITIFDEIGIWGIDATMFKNDLDKVKNSASIKLLINSPGGSVFDGVAIYNMLKDVRDKLEVEVTGIAASIASIIAIAGKTIKMREGTFLMIHRPWTMTMGEADELRKSADLLDQIETQMVGIYKGRTNLPEDQIRSMLKEETWMTPQDALNNKFIDSIDEASGVAAKFTRDFQALGFSNTPKDLENGSEEDTTTKNEPVKQEDLHEEKRDESPDTGMYEKRLRIIEHEL